MIDYNNPVPAPIANPSGLDAQIQPLQLELGQSLSWVSNSFGRAYKGIRKMSNMSGRSEYYPEVENINATDKDRYIAMLPNSRFGNFSFFYPKDPLEHTEVLLPSKPNNFLKQKVDWIFWGNLDTIAPNRDHRLTEKLKEDVRLVIRNHTNFIISKEYGEAEEVFKGFDIKEVDNQYFKNPYFGFKFELDLTYRVNCLKQFNTYE